MPHFPPPYFLVCYDPVELEELLFPLHAVERAELPGAASPVYKGTLGGQPCTVVRLPFGDRLEALKLAASELFRRFRPRALFSLGTAMALEPALPRGQVVVSSGASFHGRTLEFGGEFRRLMEQARPHGVNLTYQRSVTTDAFVQTPDQGRELLTASPGTGMIEMEDYHLAEAAARAQVPFFSLRVVTDQGSFEEHMASLREAARLSIRMYQRFFRQLAIERFLVHEENPNTTEISYHISVRSEKGSLFIPQAVRLARNLCRQFRLKTLIPHDSLLDLVIAPPAEWKTFLNTPSGQAKVWQPGEQWLFVHDPQTFFTRIVFPRENLAIHFHADQPPVPVLGRLESRLVPKVPFPGNRRFTLPVLDKLHIQGLNSISAEPEEGLLAAATIEEARSAGLEVVHAEEARIWLYRTANVSETSYFQTQYEFPYRSLRAGSSGDFCIATGIGPMVDPGAEGGRDAQMLILGDELCGRWLQILEDLAASPFSLSDVFRHEGLILRVEPGTVLLSRADRRAFLSESGLNALILDPLALRKIYSPAYDRFLQNYFGASRRSEPAIASHLYLTSRGCGSGCSICCSGGFQPFSALSAEQVSRGISRFIERENLQPGQYLDIFLLDSNFNRDPNRVISLANQLDRDNVLPYVELYIRHNALGPFLLKKGRENAPPIVHRELIRAYRRLGINEIVIGIDAYTDLSILLLKTHIQTLRRLGRRAEPSYSFADIEAVLTAMEEEGLTSRCFLLINNPFLDDADRLQTFYHLLRLALKLPGFRIDYESSSRVNELKPFPGAPLTRVADRLPGMIRGDRFCVPTMLPQLEHILGFELFGERRFEESGRRRLLTGALGVRRQMCEYLRQTLETTRDLIQMAAVEAAREFLRLEETLSERFREAALGMTDLMTHEEEMTGELARLRLAVSAFARPTVPRSHEKLDEFFRLLQEVIPAPDQAQGG